MDDASMSLRQQAPRHVGAHAAETDHAHLHRHVLQTKLPGLRPGSFGKIAVQGCTARGSSAHALDPAEASTGMYRTRRVQKSKDGLLQEEGTDGSQGHCRP